MYRRARWFGGLVACCVVFAFSGLQTQQPKKSACLHLETSETLEGGNNLMSQALGSFEYFPWQCVRPCHP